MKFPAQCNLYSDYIFSNHGVKVLAWISSDEGVKLYAFNNLPIGWEFLAGHFVMTSGVIVSFLDVGSSLSLLINSNQMPLITCLGTLVLV